MPAPSIQRLSQQALERRASGSTGARRIQLRVEFRMDKHSRTPGQLLGSVGGEWDLDERRFVGPGTQARVWFVTELQRATVVYWFAWLRAYITGDWVTFIVEHGARPFSVWTVGGRRRGKTWIGLRFLAAFAIACPDAVPPWLVSPIETDFKERKELWLTWAEAVPPSWYEWVAKKDEYWIQLVNGARILMFSAHDAEKLKNGATGYCFWNEVQKSNARQRGLNNIRGGAADTGTLVHLAANPPREPDEYWIEEILEKLERGEVEGRFFDFRGDNPYVNEAALDSMKSEMSLRDYRIERGGERLPRPDIVLYEFVDGLQGNVRPAPADGNITGAFLKRKLGRPFAALVGADFQKNPHEAACVDEYFEDPLNPTDVLSWTRDEAVIDQGDENDLIDALEALGYRGRDTLRCMNCDHEMALARLTADVPAACSKCRESWAGGPGHGVELLLATAAVTDATGKYQRSERDYNKARGYGDEHGSWAMFRARGWTHLFQPDPTQKRNPHVDERVAVANARLCTADGRRHAFIEPHCVRTIEAVKHWPNAKWGGPSRQSQFSHVGDGWTYKHFRLWPRRPASRGDIAPQLVDIHGRDDRAWTAGRSGDDDRLPPGLRRE